MKGISLWFFFEDTISTDSSFRPCCLTLSFFNNFSKSSAASLPGFTQPTVCQLRGQSYYVEVALGFPAASADKVSESEHIQIKKEMDSVKDSQLGVDGQRKVESPDSLPVLERTFIYPPEAVLVPMVHQAFVRFSSKRYKAYSNFLAITVEGMTYILFFAECVYRACWEVHYGRHGHSGIFLHLLTFRTGKNYFSLWVLFDTKARINYWLWLLSMFVQSWCCL